MYKLFTTIAKAESGKNPSRAGLIGSCSLLVQVNGATLSPETSLFKHVKKVKYVRMSRHNIGRW